LRGVADWPSNSMMGWTVVVVRLKFTVGSVNARA
jgi:hypothetical protein